MDQRPEVHISTRGFGYSSTGKFCNLPRRNSFILPHGFVIIIPHGFVVILPRGFVLFFHKDFSLFFHGIRQFHEDNVNLQSSMRKFRFSSTRKLCSSSTHIFVYYPTRIFRHSSTWISRSVTTCACQLLVLPPRSTTARYWSRGRPWRRSFWLICRRTFAKHSRK